MRRFWPPLIVILTLITGPAHAQSVKSPEEKLGGILAIFSNPDTLPYLRANPQFKCWHMGRLHAYADVLRVAGNPLHLKAEPMIENYLPAQDCDASFTADYRLQTEGDLPRKILLLLKRMNGVALEDIVPACFHVGRLSILTGRLSEFLREKTAAGAEANIKYHALYKRSAAEVKKRFPDCRATASY